MNTKFLFVILVIAMLLASGCVSVIKSPDEDASEDDIEGFDDADEIEDDLDEVEDELDAADEDEAEDGDEEEDNEGLPTKTVNEGELVSFPNLKAVDPDGDSITYTFSSPLDAKGEWQTKEGDAGKYKVTITASDGVNEVSQDVMLIIKSLNNAPVLEEIDDITVEVGDTVELEPVATDEDGDDVEVTFSGWMTSSEKEATEDDIGKNTVTITASDGKDSTTQKVSITVKKVNKAPVIDALDDINVGEGEEISVTVGASDPDGDDVEVTFSEPLDDDGEWQTEEGDAGKYKVTVTASDGAIEVEETFYIIVQSANKAPVLEGVADIEVDEGALIELEITAEDPEGEDVEITFSEPLDDDGVWQTGYDDAGEYEVTVTASDGTSETEETFTITVNDVNRPPAFGEGSFD